MMKTWLVGWVAMLGFVVFAAQAAPPLTAYGNLPAVEVISLSPDGGAIASVAVDGNVRRLIVRYLDARPPQVFGLGNEKVRSLSWIGDDRLLILLSRTAHWGGYRGANIYEWGSAIAINLKNKKSIVLFHGNSGAFGNILRYYGSLQLGDRWFVYVASQSMQGGAERLFKVDADTGANENIGFLDGHA